MKGEPETDVVIKFERIEYVDPKIRAVLQSDLHSSSPSSSSLLSSPSSSSSDDVGKDVNKVIHTTTIRRRSVRMSDIRLATLLGKPGDGLGYVNLGGFNAGASRDFRNAVLMLRSEAGPTDLKGLILDLRGTYLLLLLLLLQLLLLLILLLLLLLLLSTTTTTTIIITTTTTTSTTTCYICG